LATSDGFAYYPFQLTVTHAQGARCIVLRFYPIRYPSVGPQRLYPRTLGRPNWTCVIGQHGKGSPAERRILVLRDDQLVCIGQIEMGSIQNAILGSVEEDAFQSEMRRRLVDHVYLPTGEDLVRRFGKRRSDIPNFAFAPTSLWGGITEKELQDWEKKLNSFQTHFDRVSKSQMLRLLGSISQVYILEVKIKNEGEAPDRNVYVEFETRGAASLCSLHELESDWA
jgi:hypothetical protein